MSITYLTGPAGAGKTSQAVEHLRTLLIEGVPAHTILVVVPQLTLARPYRQLSRDATLPAAGTVDILTLNGLALRTISLFWPLGAVSGGFGRPHARPVFLNIEQSQYFLRQAIAPLLKEGYFDPGVVPITVSLTRLMSQLLDDLNKAALIGLPHTEVGSRLAGSLTLEPSSSLALEHTQVCVNRFREFCLARNLMDFSLRVETFFQHLWPVPGVQQYLTQRYRHLIVDNVEEDTSFAHTILSQWFSHADSGLVVNDEDAGYRIFLGANWRTARKLAGLADQISSADGSFVASPDMLAFGEQMAALLRYQPGELPQVEDQLEPGHKVAPANRYPGHKILDLGSVMTFDQQRFFPQMLDWVITKITELVDSGTPASEIVVLAPFVSDALRFAFMHQMEQRGLPARSHRPSRPLSEEPATKTMLTLARLVFGPAPEAFDVTQSLSQAILDLDLIRASLLTQVVYRPNKAADQMLSPFEAIEGPTRDRISYRAGQRFDQLRTWLLLVAAADPDTWPVLDHFFSRLFGEVLSQSGFGLHNDPEAGEVAANLIDSARQFRQVAGQVPIEPGSDDLPRAGDLSRAFLETIEQGIAAAQYIRGWDPASEAAADDAVLITPATTFLMSNRPVDYQFWLDAGSSGWWERIAQPLTHPYILAADWPPGRAWTDAEEVAAQHDRLARLLLGLTRRCRQHIFIANAETGEQGFEQRGQLLQVLQRLLRRLQRQKTDEIENVEDDLQEMND